jgi:hypothetical protein
VKWGRLRCLHCGLQKAENEAWVTGGFCSDECAAAYKGLSDPVKAKRHNAAEEAVLTRERWRDNPGQVVTVSRPDGSKVVLRGGREESNKPRKDKKK